MEYKILELSGVENENIDGGAFNNFAAGSKSGIIAGVLDACKVSISGVTLTMGTGLLLLNGIRIKLTEPTQFNLFRTPAEDTNYQVVAQAIVHLNRDVEFNLFIRTPQTLIQDNFYKKEQGTYELEIARFTHYASGEISNLVTTAKVLTNEIKIVQTIGYSSSSVMSQDATTKELNNIKNQLNTLKPANLNKLNNKVNTLYNVLDYKQITQVAEDVPNNKAFRQTAEYSYFDEDLWEEVTGTLDVVDGSYTKVTKIQGKGTLSGIKSRGRNTAKADNFIGRALVKNNDGTYTITKGSSRFSGTADLFLPAGSRISSAEIISIYDPSQGGYTNEANFGLGLMFLDKNGKKVQGGDGVVPANVGPSIDGVKTQSVNSQKCEIYLSTDAPDGYSITFKNLMISSGREYIPYEPYTESIMTLPTPLTLDYFQEWKDGKIYDYLGSYSIYGSTDVTYYGLETEEDDDGKPTDKFVSFDSNYVTIIDRDINYPVVGTKVTGELDGTTYTVNFDYYEDCFVARPTPAMTEVQINTFVRKYRDNEGASIKYKTLTPTITDFTFDNEYQVWNGGTEEKVGDNLTVHNEYLVYFGEEGGDK